MWKYIADGVACFAAGAYLTHRYYAQVVSDLKAVYSSTINGVQQAAKKL